MFRRILLVMCLVPGVGCSAPKVDRSPPPPQNVGANASANANASVGPAADKGVWPRKFPFKVLYIARHSSTVFNRYLQIGGQIKYDPLDSLGFKQRAGVFLLLRDEPIGAIYTSLQRRSQMTAAPLAAHLKLKIRPTAALNEFAAGISEGICYSLLGKKATKAEAVACDEPSDDPLVKRAEAFLRKENKRRFKVGISYRWPGGGESILDVNKRLDKWLRTLPAGRVDGTVLFVGHSGTNRFLLAKLMGWKPLSAARVRQGHTQVWRIERKGPGKLELRMYVNGKWVDCPEPPTMTGGLPCLVRHRRPKPRPAPTETKVKDLDKDGKPIPKGGPKPDAKVAPKSGSKLRQKTY
jgi:broad specificity phosphatase PhoE